MPTAAVPATRDELIERLARGHISRLAAAAWDGMAGTFPEAERHATGVAGDLVIVRIPGGLAAVETPSDGEVVVRPLAGPDAARRFVERRLAQYERMWEGCGCRIDYDA